MAEPKKRGNSWHGVVYSHTDENGKRVYKSITAPTKADWYRKQADFLADKDIRDTERAEKDALGITVGEAIDKYIDRKDGLRSPTTIAGYRKIRATRFQSLMDVPVSQLTKDTLQEAVIFECKAISRRGRVVSPKTIKNSFSLILTALDDICEVRYKVSLPEVHKKILDMPPVEDVFNAIKDTDIELPCLLAMWLSFSLSEVRGLKCSSVRRDKIYIDQVKVFVDGADIVKEAAKEETRTRAHTIPPYIMNLIKAQDVYSEYISTGKDDFLIQLNMNQIRHRFERIMDKAGYPDMSFHKLRHLNASVMVMLGVPDKYAQERGGWKTDHIMKSVYQHTFSSERQIVDSKIDAFFDSIVHSESVRG